jgi:hypothetical protein
VKTSTLDLGTRCPDCGRRLHFDVAGESYCLYCTLTFCHDGQDDEPAALAPFIALVGAEVVEQADTLEELLAILRDILDDVGTEDVAVWQGPCLLLVLHADGRVTRFDGGTR